jgi:hypothetical protein
MERKLIKELRVLKFYTLTVTIVCLALFSSGFVNPNSKKKFEEIDVERINVVEKDGKLKMVISNKARQHPGIVNGKLIERDHPRPPGLIFFNQLGDEMGGLVYGSNGPEGHFGSFTWDKVRGDQTIGFRHLEGSNGSYSSGVSVWQQPNVTGDIIKAKLDALDTIADPVKRKVAIQQMRDDNLLMTSRLFLGKSRDDASLLVMNDIKGNPRVVIMVDQEGNPKMEFRDEQGKVIFEIPESNKP